MQPKFNFKKSSVSHKIQACPVSYEQVDKHLIKAYSSTVFFVLLFTLLSGRYGLMYAISIDFIIRVFAGIKYSPLCKVLTSSMRISAVKPVLINAGTKKISAQAGLIFSCLICIFHLLGWQTASLLVAFVFMSAIAVDLLFNYCLACKMQSLYLTYWKK